MAVLTKERPQEAVLGRFGGSGGGFNDLGYGSSWDDSNPNKNSPTTSAFISDFDQRRIRFAGIVEDMWKRPLLTTKKPSLQLASLADLLVLSPISEQARRLILALGNTSYKLGKTPHAVFPVDNLF